MDLSWILAFVLLGLINGVLAGLLGIGGGMVIVPAMIWLAPKLGVSQDLVMHVALGTSMATICFVAVASARSHYRRGSVNTSVLKSLIPGIAIGALLGAMVAKYLETQWLAWFFALFCIVVAIKMLLDKNPQGEGAEIKNSHSLPSGIIMGAISSLVGIGGGSLVVPYLLYHKEKMVTAIGTAAACGLPLAIMATIGYIITGWQAELSIPHLGYVFWPATLAIAAGSMLTASLGAALAHKLPTSIIKRIFAILMIVVAIKIIAEYF